MVADPKNGVILPRVAMVTRNAGHARDLEGALKRRFHLSIFDDTYAAGEALAKAPPDVVLMDVERSWKSGIDWLHTNAGSPTFKSLPFVFLGKKGEKFHDIRALFDRSSHFLNWPLYTTVMVEALSDLISAAAEEAWEELPKVQAAPLKMTVAEYQGIATAIGNGEPISYNSAARSCAPLVEAVRGNAHHELLKSVQSHHNYTYVHSMRVATLLTLFGCGIGMKDKDLLILSTGGLLHDVGKMVTPSNILDKPDRLSDEEWTVMKAHVTESESLLENGEDITRGAMLIARQHHEKLDGTGYPGGLRGRELNELARMSVIADIFGALTDVRSYKPAFSTGKSFAILEGMKIGVDQHLLGIFKDIFTATQPRQDAVARPC